MIHYRYVLIVLMFFCFHLNATESTQLYEFYCKKFFSGLSLFSHDQSLKNELKKHVQARCVSLAFFISSYSNDLTLLKRDEHANDFIKAYNVYVRNCIRNKDAGSMFTVFKKGLSQKKWETSSNLLLLYRESYQENFRLQAREELAFHEIMLSYLEGENHVEKIES